MPSRSRKPGGERAKVKRIADSLCPSGEMNIAAIYRDVLMKQADAQSAAAQLAPAESKTLAYELTVCMCNADGAQSVAERQFPSQLAQTFGAETGHAQSFSSNVESLAAAPLAACTSAEPPHTASTMSSAEQDKMVLNYAILNGALELLPDTMASMAIIPLQMKMVYRIGKSDGYELDREQIRDFLATVGVWLASQYLEQASVKLIGKVFGRGLVGSLIGSIAKQAVSSGLSFGTTYALGHLAKRYYAGGRTFSTAVIRETCQSLLGEAKSLEGQYLPAIHEKARTINIGQIPKEVRA